jgi:hypothetical protein
LEGEVGLTGSWRPKGEDTLGIGGAFGVGSQRITAGIAFSVFSIHQNEDEGISDFAWTYERTTDISFAIGAYGIYRFFELSPVGFALITEAGVLIDTKIDRFDQVDSNRTNLVPRDGTGRLYVAGGVGLRVYWLELYVLIDTTFRLMLRPQVRLPG